MASGQSLLLEVSDLAVDFRVYGEVLKVLDDVNFHVLPGEKVGLVGETGCGKTTRPPPCTSSSGESSRYAGCVA